MLRRVMVATILAAALPAGALELGNPEEPLGVAVHGFASPGFLLSTRANYLPQSKHGSFEFSEVGINFTKPLGDRLRFGLQLFSRDLGATGDYSAKVDWFYADYRWQDWLGLRAGRVKLPFGLYNETSDVDAGRVPVLLPQSVYPIQNRDYLLAQTGAELYGFVDLDAGGALDYRLYAGTIFFDTSASAASIKELTTPVLGGRLLWETPLEGLRLGASLQSLMLTSRIILPPITGTAAVANYDVNVILWLASAEYAAHDLLLAVEYGQWDVDTDIGVNKRAYADKLRQFDPKNAFLHPPYLVTEQGYAMAAYRLTPWFQPGAYYSLSFPNKDERGDRSTRQHDLAGTLRFDLNENWLVKLESHYMYGTTLLNPALNDDIRRERLQRRWGLFLLKTTVYF